MADTGEFLEHFGIKGMKWGQHLKRGSHVSKSSSGHESHSSTHDEHFSDRPKAKSLSNAELKARINRMQLEKQYNDLQKGPEAKSAQKAGSDFVKKVALNTLQSQAQNYANKYAQVGIELAIKKAMNH